MNGETPEQEIARLKKESHQLATALADVRDLVSQMGQAGNTHVNLWGRKLADYLRPVNDLVILVRARR